MRISGVYTFHAVLPCGKVEKWKAKNTLTHEGFKYMLDVMWDKTATPSPSRWRFGYVSIDGFTAFAQTDTLTSHPGWAEEPGGRFTVGTSEAPVAVDGLTATKTFTKVFSSISDPFNARGIFFTDTFNDSGFLVSTADFDEGPKILPVGTELTITYVLTMDL